MTLPLPPEMADGLHRYGVRVYYEDTDAGGIVYHANYLRFAERARTEALREAGIPHAALVERFNLMFVVRRAEVDYQRPARLDETIIVETETVDVAGASVLLRQTIRGPNGICVVARIKLACVQIETSRAARIPPEWWQALDAMRHDAAAAAATKD